VAPARRLPPAPQQTQARQDTLLAWQAASKDGIITFSSEDWEEFAMVKDRPYHLVVFCAAASLMSSPKTQLNNLRAEYSLAAQVGARAGVPAMMAHGQGSSCTGGAPPPPHCRSPARCALPA
jgi:hypothetical protein